MKDPNGPRYDIRQCAKESLEAMKGLSHTDREMLIEQRCDEFTDFANEWLIHGEYIMIEFDTEQGTARLMKFSEI